MVDINKKLVAHIGYDAETIGELVNEILIDVITFYYKDVEYLIDVWGGDDWAIQTNADEHDTNVEWKVDKFKRDRESIIKMIETFRFHDGTIFYEAITNPKYKKYFG